MIDSELIEIFKARENIYSLLSLIYQSEVSSEFLRNLLAGVVDYEDAVDGYTLMQEFANTARAAEPQELENQLATEYAHLFLNAGDEPHVHPYESVYTSADHLLMQEARDKVVEVYRSEGLDRAVDFKKPEDHIAVELEFMAHLCRMAAQELEAGERTKARALTAKQRNFLETHLLNWIPRFCDDLEKAACSDFYRAAAQITRYLLSVEVDVLDETVQGI